MRYFLMLLTITFIGCQTGPKKHAKMSEKQLISDYKKHREQHFYILNDLIERSIEAGKLEDAAKYAEESLTLAPLFKEDWNYGNVIFDANMAIGLKKFEEGKIKQARASLLSAGSTPGSPQLDSFGLIAKDMTLAAKLLEKGEKQTVMEFLKLTANFWKDEKSDNKTLKTWMSQISKGEIPDFKKQVE